MKTIVNLTLPAVIEQIEKIVDTYPYHPHQQAFLIPELRQKLIAHVLTSSPGQSHGDSQTSRFEFLLHSNRHQTYAFPVLRSLHRLTPLAQRFLCVESQTRVLMVCFDSRDVYHCPIFFSRSTDFSSPLRFLASFVVRVYVSIVAGGSLTTLILPKLRCKAVLEARGFYTHFLMISPAR
jgi:hypothetical protein